MFWHLYKYSLITTIKKRDIMVWTFIFPLFLGTVFFFSFGRIFEDSDTFKEIPVAVVSVDENENFSELLDELSGDGQMLQIEFMEEEAARKQLDEDVVEGIFFIKEEPELTVREKSTNASILKILLDTYLQTADVIMEVAVTHPEQVEEIIATMSEDISYVHVTNNNVGNMNVYMQYFYSLIAMNCMYACFVGNDSMIALQANLSSLGQRRNVAPTNKMAVIVSEYLAGVTIEFLVQIVLLFYLRVILQLDMGNRILECLLVMFIGSACGVALGMFTGSIPKIDFRLKIGLTMLISLLCSFMSGLMFSQMRNIIDHNCPIINKLNPAALIVDSFYALNLYETPTRITTNLLTLVGITAVLCLASFFMTRRNSYASL